MQLPIIKKLPFIKSKFDLILINGLFVLITIGVVLSLIYSYFLAEEPPLATRLESAEELENISLVTYSGSTILPLDQLPILQVTNLKSFTFFLEQLKTRYNLQSSSFTNELYVNSDQTATLLIKEDDHFLSLSLHENYPQPNETLPELEVLEQQARSYLSSLGFETEMLIQNREDITYVSSNESPTEFHEVESATEATAAMLVFQQRFNDVPVYFSSQIPQHITLSLSAKGVYKLDFLPFEVEVKAMNEQLLLPVDQAIENIRQGDYATLTDLLRVTNVDHNRISAINLTEFQLVYRLSLDDQLLIPYYDFSGQVELAGGRTSPVRLTTPAIKLRLTNETRLTN